MTEQPYNPLDRVNLARSVEVTLLQRSPEPLPLTEAFTGAGLYALYYAGDFPAYRAISSDQWIVPIYVGKADPPGARKGLVDPSGDAGTVLFNRLADHSASIEAASNLRVEDFRARYLVVADIFIGMAEQLMIQQFRPLWNVYLSGFGLHDPGSRRYGGNRSEWDELHPGRPWHAHMRQTTTAEFLEAKIMHAFESGEAASVEKVLSHASSGQLAVETAQETHEQI